VEHDDDVPDRPTARPRRRRRWIWASVALVVALVAFVLVWFQPQKLFIDERVVEAVPTLPPAPNPPAGDVTSPSPTTTTTPPTVELGRGEFVSLDHGTSGIVRVLQLGDGTRFVRLEGLDTSNGPDLYLYATANPADGAEGAFDDDIVNLGRLKGNQGDQNYEIPADVVDLERFTTVVIWCDRFDSAFGAADLVPRLRTAR
jgi:hypothetical protein